ncbi:hypothetical protein IMSAGC002_01137 [Lachnospiraceae bacterium]|nr:hypothetical protein IMSAGC002_01137 [Lachnospiraceae bacterium]
MPPAKEEKNREKDLVEKRCLSDNRRYADLINGFVFQGKQILHETDLRELAEVSFCPVLEKTP